MEKSEAFQAIKEMDGMPRAAVIAYLVQEGASQASAYRWFNQATHTDENGSTEDLVINTLKDQLYAFQAAGDESKVTELAIALAKVDALYRKKS